MVLLITANHVCTMIRKHSSLFHFSLILRMLLHYGHLLEFSQFFYGSTTDQKLYLMELYYI